jgi:hypothetical protein
MNKLFKMISIFWMFSPIGFAILRFANVVNVEHQNTTVFLVLSGISYVAIFLNSDTK